MDSRELQRERARTSHAYAAIATGLVIAVAAATVIAAQQPRIANGAVTPQPAGASLVETVRSLAARSADVSWIGYGVPVVSGDRTMCCFSSGTTWISGDVVMSDGSQCCGACRLEPSVGASAPAQTSSQQPGTVRLEPPDTMLVLLRVADREVERVRIFSEDCQLDAGGRPVAWLENVRPADSIALLESLIAGSPERRSRVTDGAISAIALHADPLADAALDRLLATGQPDHVREKVPFWLGNARGRRGLDVLRRLVANEPSRGVRKKAVFGISQSEEPAAIDTLIEAARANGNADVRGEAIFWLAQKAGTKAVGAISERIDKDPDTDVKKRAVFALSQLPKDEGVPLLINVARTHSNPAVRKQAMFWLGQSKDRRAIEFFAEILGK
jgi:hypothetical protein